MNVPQLEHGLITRILDLLDFLRRKGLGPDCLSGGGAPALPPSAQVACELIRFMDEIPGGFLLYRANTAEEIIYANRGLLRMFQCDSFQAFLDLTGNSFRGIVHPEDLESVEESIRNQVDGSQHDLDYVEYRARRKDGSLLWIEDYGHFIHDETAGDIFYVFLGDATEKHNRMLSEQATLNQEYLRRLEVIKGLSINYDTILYADLDLDQTLPYRLGPRFQGIFEAKYQARTFDDCLDCYRDAWVCQEDRAMFAQTVQREHIRRELARDPSFYINYRIPTADGFQYAQLRVVNVGSQKGHVSQVVLGFQTVDKEVRREMEHRQALAEALENANLANIARNTFLSNVSHDMRTPLNAIFGFTALAKRNIRDTGSVQSYLERIETASHQLLDLINKVLELAHTESGKAQVAEVECDLPQTIREVFDFLAPQAEEKNLDFTLDCSGVRHPNVFSDPERLNQMVMYLANNAVTYTPAGGRVSIVVRELEDLPNQYASFQLVVSDTGVGISEEFLERIFEPFVREKNTTLSGIHGIGLGLSIAKNIVEMMDGKIDVRSTPGKGSTFTITLHLRLHPKSLPQEADADPSAGDRPLRILLAEDNEINLEIETELLEELGYLIEPAENGRIAVEKLTASSPGDFDLVLTDIQMPVMDGWAAATAIRHLDDPILAHIPIIALSANVFEDDIRKSLESGIDAHLPKPMDLDLLVSTIQRIREKRLAFR